jgi:aminoglycoside 6'-N-acetyltransferase
MPSDGRPRYAFGPVTEEDFGRIADWLSTPHVARWWEPATDEIDRMSAHLIEDDVKSYIVSIDGRPAGYLQSYDPHAEADHPYQDQPIGTIGIDQFIGELDLIGLGHGPRLVKEFVRQRFEEGVPHVIVDPDPDNQRAIRAYQKAGFRILDRRISIYGPALIMRRDAEDRRD